MNENRKEIIGTFLSVVGFGLIMYCLQIFLYKACFFTDFPNDKTLLRWDADIYNNIAKIGYQYPDDSVNNSGFYVLLPWIWKLLYAGATVMSLVNLVFFAAGFTIFTRIYKADATEKLLWLSIPSLYFMYVPYTESLFCLFTAITFYGIANDKRWMIWVGIFFASLTRATAIVLVPALLIMELMAYERRYILKALKNFFISYFLPAFAGLFVFVWYQHYVTGVWFAYFKQQEKYLGHKWAMPILPFSDFFGGDKTYWLTALAMAVCVIALIVILPMFFRWLFRNRVSADRILTLTLCYLPAVLTIMIFCNPTWRSNTTNIFGLHRYTLCTPFAFVFLYHFTAGKHYYNAWHIAGVVLMCNAVWLSMGSYQHITYILYFNFSALLIIGYMLHANKKWQGASIALIAVNLLLQTLLFQIFLNGNFTD